LISNSPNPEGAISELVTVLAALAALLHKIGEDYWAAWVEKSNQQLRNRDLYGVERLLQAYGGMGSLNDVLAPEESQATLTTLRSKAWELERDEVKSNRFGIPKSGRF
jgi:hypothetical protein